ncbi:MAG: phosphate ABC transporter substrate-binding protein [Anaerolinea sp.]|nr:phosphate ABC transporter substrate-binding protein [Anaerolinea sp.]
MKRKTLAVLAVVVVLSMLLTSCGGSVKEQNKLSVSGAFALYPLMVKWAEVYQAENPDVIIDVSAGGAGKGMSDALAGAVDIGMVSRGIAQEELDLGAYTIGVTKDAVFGTVSAQNPYLADILKMGISQKTLAGIYLTGQITTWGQVLGKPEITDEIHVYTRSDACGAGEMWVKYLGGKNQEELLGIGVNADPGVLEAVIKDPLGIGYNNLNYAYDITTGVPVAGARVIPLDVNENSQVDVEELLDTQSQAVDAISSGRYPSPPARALNLVTKGKPTGTTMEFIAWILTDGQQYVAEAGYIALTPDELIESQNRLK